MKKENQITVSVRLCEAEYAALQAIADKDFTTMSGVLRRLLHAEIEGREQHGTLY